MYKKIGIKINMGKGAFRSRYYRRYPTHDTKPGPVRYIPISQYLREKEKEKENNA